MEEATKADPMNRKLEMPIFEGWNPEGWIFWAEHYFTFHRLGEAEKLEAVAVSMEGEALNWFQWANGRRPICYWQDLKNLLLERLVLTQQGSTCEKFLVIRQEGTVPDYHCLFEALSSPLTGLSEDVLESTFIKGLRPDIRVQVRMMKPSGLPQIMEFAQRVEDCMELSDPTNPGRARSGFGPMDSLVVRDRVGSVRCGLQPAKCWVGLL